MRTSGVLLSLSCGAAIVAGCASGIDNDAEAAAEAVRALGQVCATQHAGATADGDTVQICDRVFDAAPRVRPPADVRPSSGAATLYVAISLEGGTTATDRHGTTYTLVDASGAAVSTTAAHAGLPASMRLPSHRDMFLVYRVTGTIGTYADPYTHGHSPSLHVTSGAPAILLTGQAIDGAFEGVWEGDVSARTSTGFDVTHRVPLRVRFDHLAQQANLHAWSGTTTLHDGEVFALEGHIENWSTAVDSHDGHCLASLTAMGASNPFAGASSGDMSIFRLGGMHFPADEVVVVVYPAGTTGLTAEGMTGLHVMTPGDLLRVSPTTDDVTLDLFPHGAPNGNSLVLRRVADGTATTTSCR
jgi:hypothetical protein